MRLRFFKYPLLMTFGLTLLACIGPAETIQVVTPPPEDPAEVMIGERLFLETRFSQFFAIHSGGNPNSELSLGDPIMSLTQTTQTALPGPFAGKSMNCAACHLVDQQLEVFGGGMRSYNDFARRSPIPDRGDGKTLTPRNSPPLVNSTQAPGSLFLHFDGEFASIEDLVRGTLTGRNFGWLPPEQLGAVSHIAKVVREDDGRSELAGEFEFIPYKTLLLGTFQEIPEALRLPEEFRIDVTTATNDAVLQAVSRLIGAYVNNLIFTQDEAGEFNASPYDRFLAKNNLPRKPAEGESHLNYTRRLRQMLDQLSPPLFINNSEGTFRFHFQNFTFGPLELEGLKTFLREPAASTLSIEERNSGHIGNCLACHAAPLFSDFRFHNTGVTQAEYDKIHGENNFQNLFIPDFFTRNDNASLYLTANAQNPAGSGMFLDIPDLSKPGHTDLGMWNVFGNPFIPTPQSALQNLLCEQLDSLVSSCAPEQILPFTIGMFKTPNLRDSGHSAPYMHEGSFDTLDQVIQHYIDFSEHAQAGLMRNPPREFLQMSLKPEDISALVSFLKALNEDYE